MPDIDEASFREVLKKRPEGMSEEDTIRLMVKKGYTFGGKHVDPHTLIAYDNKMYSNHDEMSKPRAAWEAIKETYQTPIPGLDQFGKFLSSDAPGYIAEKTGASSSTMVRGAGLAAGTALGTVGEMVPRTVGDVSLQALTGPALKGLGAAAKALKPAVSKFGEIGTSLLARDIGIAEPFIENVKANTKVLQNLSQDMGVVLEHAKSVGSIMKRGVERLGSHITAIEDALIESKITNPDSLEKISLDDVSSKIKEIKFKKGVSGNEAQSAILGPGGKPIESSANKKLSNIDAITGMDAKRIDSIHSEIDSVKNNANAIDLIRIKRKLGDEIAWGKGDEVAKKIGSQTNGILKTIYGDIKSKIESLSPEMKEANAEYAKARQQYDILQNKVFGGTPEEAYQRVRLRIMRGIAPEALLQRAAQINHASEAAMKGLIDRVSAQQFAPPIRKGIAGGALGVGAGATGALMMMGHGWEAIAADLAAAAISSPRLAALGIRASEAAKSAVAKSVAETSPKAVEAAARVLNQSLSERLDTP